MTGTVRIPAGRGFARSAAAAALAGCLATSMATGAAAATATVVSASLNDVSCTSGHSCMAVGTFLTSKGPEFTLAEAWNGTHWTVTRTPPP